MRRRAALTVLALAASAHAAAPPARPGAPLGAYLGPGCKGVERVPAFERWLGRRPERASDFLAQDSWREMVKAAERASRCWQPTQLPLTLGVPMLPRDRSGTLAEGARGAYDAHFVQIAQALVANGMGSAVLRLGWEFNQGWFAWAAAKDPEAWVAYWRRIVAAMRAVPGAAFRFDWNPAWGRGQIEPERVYPGDDVVDIIGLDVYNTAWSQRTPAERWWIKVNGTYGLKWQRDFARAHGKPVSFPEWATGTRPDGGGAGDDAYFVEQMAAWIASSEIAYHGYWDYPARDYNGQLSDGSKPLAAAAFLASFGRVSDAAR